MPGPSGRSTPSRGQEVQRRAARVPAAAPLVDTAAPDAAGLPETLRRASEPTRVRLMSTLQATIGNRGVQAIVQRYEGGEHAQFGARAGEVEKKFTVNGVEMTYGEVIAMGDLFKDRDGFRQCSKTELEALLTLIRRERDKGIGSVTEKDWIEAAGQRYVDLASKNEGHFAAAGSP